MWWVTGDVLFNVFQLNCSFCVRAIDYAVYVIRKLRGIHSSNICVLKKWCKLNWIFTCYCAVLLHLKTVFRFEIVRTYMYSICIHAWNIFACMCVFCYKTFSPMPFVRWSRIVKTSKRSTTTMHSCVHFFFAVSFIRPNTLWYNYITI